MNTGGSTRSAGWGRTKWYAVYAGLFLVLSALIFSWHYRAGRTLIYQGDGYYQHVKALLFYSKWLRACIGRFLSGDFSLPSYSLAVGYGSDILTTFSYYVIGDPLTLVSVFFKEEQISGLYQALILIRFFLAGAAFSEFIFYYHRRRDPSVLGGALLYTFSGFALYAGVKHPFFLNPMIYFPLLLLGAERILRERKGGFFALMTAVSAVSNFYFFYMLALFTAFFALWRGADIAGKQGWKRAAAGIAQITVCAFTGVLISGILFFPTVLHFLQSPRFRGRQLPPLRYYGEYYKGLFVTTLGTGTAGFWTRLGVGGAGISAAALLFTKGRRCLSYQVMFLFFSFLLLFPAGGYMLSGFDAPKNRWCWAFVFVIAWMFVLMWEDFFTLSAGRFLVLVLVWGVYDQARRRLTRGNDYKELRIGLLLWFALLCCLGVFTVLQIWEKRSFGSGDWSGRLKRAGEPVLLLFVCCGILVNAYSLYAPQMRGYAAAFPLRSVLEARLPEAEENADGMQEEKRSLPAGNLLYTGAWAVKQAAFGEVFPRFEEEDTYISINSSAVAGIPSVRYYWSLSNPYLARLSDELALNDYLSNHFNGLDERTALLALMNVLYYHTCNPLLLPFGFEQLAKEQNRFSDIWPVYKNGYALPFGYVCRKGFTQKQWGKMDAVQRQEALLQGVLLEELPQEIGQIVPEYSGTELLYRVEEMRGARQEKQGTRQRVRTDRKGASIRLAAGMLPGTETYLYVKGLRLPENTRKIQNIYVAGMRGETQVLRKKLRLIGPAHDWYVGRDDFIINLGYHKEPLTGIKLQFEKRLSVSFDSLRLISIPMDHLPDRLAQLGKESLQKLNLHADEKCLATDRITGEITLGAPGVMCLTLPFEEGWTAFADGQERALLCVNRAFLGLALPEGAHRIELRYKTPGMRTGAVLSLAGLLILAAICRRRPRIGAGEGSVQGGSGLQKH